MDGETDLNEYLRLVPPEVKTANSLFDISDEGE